MRRRWFSRMQLSRRLKDFRDAKEGIDPTGLNTLSIDEWTFLTPVGLTQSTSFLGQGRTGVSLKELFRPPHLYSSRFPSLSGRLRRLPSPPLAASINSSHAGLRFNKSAWKRLSDCGADDAVRSVDCRRGTAAWGERQSGALLAQSLWAGSVGREANRKRPSEDS